MKASKPKWNSGLVSQMVFQQVLKSSAMLVVPNCYWTGYECDLLAIEKGMRIIDIEVKISRADLKADMKKDKWWHTLSWRCEGPPNPRPWPPKVWKHWFALPEGIWDDSLYSSIPANSGVMLMEDNRQRIRIARAPRPNRDAPKIEAADAINLARLSNYRLWGAQQRIWELEGA
ncbi:hypothetical protein FDI24_gp148 [Acidovorax phage ACP17]|uniref:MmcB family DNA repair protein n=1 Tax=Acidovorax phage ACP17 TaxID=2010329 RepID=A0A218M303_9CAUD|nr:hypothetical protein FDI24_gp148 [Acidovorax phage ACP17]ASD50429.1 hypothetical protein [Acidovorax phage ACP17]